MVIKGRYEPIEVAGRGGQGRVIRARDLQHDRPVALKVRPAGPPGERQALLSEAKVLLSMRPHPGISLVREDFFEDDCYYLVMDWVDGRNMRDVLAAEGSPGLPLDRVAGLLTHVADALDHLHSHDPPIVHRDVKPSNIVTTQDGRAVLVDFGVAEGATRGYGFGTSGYLAPELWSGKPPTASADVFALAVTAFELLTGALPEVGSRPRLPADQAERLERAFARGLAADPSKRPSASEFVASLLPPPVPGNLPTPLTRLVGRETELRQLRSALDAQRLVTLTGLGGIGKTRLAIAAARESLASFPGGVWLVRLDSIADSKLVPDAIARAVGAREEPNRTLLESIAERIGSARSLIVLDCCEHLLEACAQAAEWLLEAGPELRIVATSRERLRIGGEAVVQVGPLAPPDVLDSPDKVARWDSVRLFADRAALVKPGFRITRSNASAVARICADLEGIPLAVELAASRMESMTAGAIADRLRDKLSLLTGGSRTIRRQQTVEATLDWSFDLLDTMDRTLFVRMAVFNGGFGVDAALAVCADRGVEREGVARALRLLEDRSVIAADTGGERYRLLDLVRDYSWRRLRDRDEERTIRNRHLGWCAELAETLWGDFQGPRQGEVANELELEHDNLRAAMDWALEGGDVSDGLRIASALAIFWRFRGHWSEGLNRLGALLDADGSSDHRLRAQALYGAGMLAWSLGRLAEARGLCEEALDMRRALADDAGIAIVLSVLGPVHDGMGDLDAADACLTESLERVRGSGRRDLLGNGLNNLANLRRRQGRLSEAESLTREALEVARQTGQHGVAAVCMNNLAGIVEGLGRTPEALGLLEEALETQRRLSEKAAVHSTFQSLAGMLLAQRKTARARELLREDLSTVTSIGDELGLADCLDSFALVAAQERDFDRAARLLGAARGARTRRGRAERSEFPGERVERLVSEALGDDRYACVHREGASLTADEAAALARET